MAASHGKEAPELYFACGLSLASQAPASDPVFLNQPPVHLFPLSSGLIAVFLGRT